MPITRRIFPGAGADSPAKVQAMASSDRIAVGMIATGSRLHELLEAFKRIEGTEIAGACDACKGRVEWAIERGDSRIDSKAWVARSFERILDDPVIDAVTIGTPDRWPSGWSSRPAMRATPLDACK